MQGAMLAETALTILGTVFGRPSASFSPLFVPAPEYPETPNTEGICALSKCGIRGARSSWVLVA